MGGKFTQKLQKSGEVQGVLNSCEVRLFTQKLRLENEQDFDRRQLYPGCLCITGKGRGARVWTGLSAGQDTGKVLRCRTGTSILHILAWFPISVHIGKTLVGKVLPGRVPYRNGSAITRAPLLYFGEGGNDLSQGLLNFITFSI